MFNVLCDVGGPVGNAMGGAVDFLGNGFSEVLNESARFLQGILDIFTFLFHTLTRNRSKAARVVADIFGYLTGFRLSSVS